MAVKTNGSVLSFGGTTQSGVISLSSSSSHEGIRVDDLSDTVSQYEAGIPDVVFSATVLGVSSIVFGATGALSVTWTGGTTQSIATAICLGAEVSGEKDGAIQTTLTWKHYQA